ncbi:hypothetical protein RHMOL_Rhmol06G0224600 [Rhododendron molle]|uniref:Uncharacterized protein n=1 Tax=Rhododendron molle TaxID=49168 RepID=A0ACC0NFE7_RHOML|nr:hypothetical protein RHMOL_Rhmol06G0224600 [Rhododendron molle]
MQPWNGGVRQKKRSRVEDEVERGHSRAFQFHFTFLSLSLSLSLSLRDHTTAPLLLRSAIAEDSPPFSLFPHNTLYLLVRVLCVVVYGFMSLPRVDPVTAAIRVTDDDGPMHCWTALCQVKVTKQLLPK